MDFIRNLFRKKQKAITPGSGKPTKINLIIGNTPPPGAAVFRADGTIGQSPDSPDARHRWVVQKMTLKIEQEPEEGEWYFERGKALMSLKRYGEAISDFTKLVDLYPTWGEYYHLRGLCYLSTGDRARAKEDLQRYRDLSVPSRKDPYAIKLLEALEKDSQS